MRERGKHREVNEIWRGAGAFAVTPNHHFRGGCLLGPCPRTGGVCVGVALVGSTNGLFVHDRFVAVDACFFCNLEIALPIKVAAFDEMSIVCLAILIIVLILSKGDEPFLAILISFVSKNNAGFLIFS